MSANIYWEPVKPNPKSLGVSAPSSFIEGMEKAFGKLPLILGTESLPVLRGMQAAKFEQAEKLIHLIDKYHSLRIWAEY